MATETKLQFISNYSGHGAHELKKALKLLQDPTSPLCEASQEIAGYQHNGRDLLEVFMSYVRDVILDNEHTAPVDELTDA